MPNIGPIEIIIVLLILLVIFGPKRIPELGRSVGQGMRNFKHSVTGRDSDDEPRELEAERAAAPRAEPATAQPEPVAASAGHGEARDGATSTSDGARTSERTREPGL